MSNASDLMDKPEPFEAYWTTCFIEFVLRKKPNLNVYKYIANPKESGPWFERREAYNEIGLSDITLGHLIREPQVDIGTYYSGLVEWIDLNLDVNVKGNGSDGKIIIDNFETTISVIGGISPDIVIRHPLKNEIILIENKPFFGSSLTAAQSSEYVKFVKHLNINKNIRCQYLLLHTLSWDKCDSQGMELQNGLKDLFGVLLWDDIFLTMDKEYFNFDGRTNWKDYTSDLSSHVSGKSIY